MQQQVLTHRSTWKSTANERACSRFPCSEIE